MEDKEFRIEDFTHMLIKNKGRYAWEDLRSGERISTKEFVEIIRESNDDKSPAD